MLFRSLRIIILSFIMFISVDAQDAITFNTNDMIKTVSTLTQDDYKSLLDELKKTKSTDFFRLRMAYTKTETYSPYGFDEKDLIDSTESRFELKDFKGAEKFLTTLLNLNYVNIKAHMYCGYLYKNLNDSIKSEYHNNIYNELLKSIYTNGNGRTPETAFIVINGKEEYDLLNASGLKLTEQTLIESDNHKYDLLEFIDNNDEKFEIYFNIDLPMAKMRESFKNIKE